VELLSSPSKSSYMTCHIILNHTKSYSFSRCSTRRTPELFRKKHSSGSLAPKCFQNQLQCVLKLIWIAPMEWCRITKELISLLLHKHNKSSLRSQIRISRDLSKLQIVSSSFSKITMTGFYSSREQSRRMTKN